MSTDTITFVAHPTVKGAFVPMIDGIVLVKAPATDGKALTGGPLPYVNSTDLDAKRGKGTLASRILGRVNTGRWQPIDGLLTQRGNLRSESVIEGIIAKAQEGMTEARSARKAELDAASAERKAQAKAEAKAAKAAKAEAKAAKTQAAKPAPAADGANLAAIRFAKDREAAADMIAAGMTVDEVAGMYGVDAGMVERLTNLVFASLLDEADEVEVSAADVAAA